MKSILGSTFKATIVVAVMDSTGKLVMESILETEAATILQFFAEKTLSQVPRRETFVSTRVLGAGALVDRVLRFLDSYCRANVIGTGKLLRASLPPACQACARIGSRA